MSQWTRVFVILAGALAGGLPSAANAEDFDWQDLYRCSLYASSVSELLTDQGRNGAKFDKEFDALVAAALAGHQAEYTRLHPSATREDRSTAWDTDTAGVEDAFLRELDASESADDFLRAGYGGCGAEISYALMKRLGSAGTP